MKKMIIAMILTLVSFQSFASSECSLNALEISKSALDQKARAYGFEGSDLLAESLVVTENGEDGSATFSVEGYIYKASYTVTSRLDSLCGVEFLIITENI